MGGSQPGGRVGRRWKQAGAWGGGGTRSSLQPAPRQRQLPAEGTAWLEVGEGLLGHRCPFCEASWRPRCQPEAGLRQAQGETHPDVHPSGVRRKRGETTTSRGRKTAAPGHGEALKQVFIFINPNASIHSGQSDSKLQNREPHNPQPEPQQGAPLTELQRPKQGHRESSAE